MGIRFQCRNGHKLHVKSFLAGKRAICPECGVKLLIPNDLKDDKSSTLNGAIQVITTGPLESGQKVDMAPVPRREAQNRPPGAPPLPPTGLRTGTGSDLIDEAPHAVWYIRPPTGEQYGPASGEVLRGWIAEGRVTSNCHVWCEGWDDWRSADVLLQPNHVPTKEPPTTVGPVVIKPLPTADVLQIDTARRANARVKQRKRALMWVCILLFVCLVLLFPLIYLITVGP